MSTQKLQVPPELQGTVQLMPWDRLYNWSRKRSLWPLAFGLACCAVEFFATAASRFDLGRFGMEIVRASPRQADLMIISGTVTKNMAPLLVRLYNQMPEPKYVIAMGACAISGGPFKEGYNVVSGVDKLIPVDVYILGCPPRPEALLHGVLCLHAKMDKETIRGLRWYQKGDDEGIPVPTLGPDMVDWKFVDKIATLGTGEGKKDIFVEAQVSQELSKNDLARSPRESTLKAPGPFFPSTQQTKEAFSVLSERFPGATQPAEYEGLVIAPELLVGAATLLRDKLGYAYLSCVTGVDYPKPPACFETIYHLFRDQGGPLTLRVRTSRDDPVIPSLASVWPSANFQEREAWDLMGIRFEGHPDLRRILLWEGFAGHPLRKDWHEPYYEAEYKPFPSRFPKGQPVRSEERTPLGRNLQFLPDWLSKGSVLNPPKGWESQAKASVYAPRDEDARNDERSVRKDYMMLNIGPQHPSTHGVLRLVAHLEGETIQHLEPVLGYLHRCHEKIGERNTWLGNMPYTDRLDYITSMTNNFGYALAVEKLLDIEVPERAEYIRVIMAELSRLVNHFLAIGALYNDLGNYFTAFLYGMEARELILDLFEMVSGSRMMCNYFRFGGVARDLPEGFLPAARELVAEGLPRRVDELETFLADNEIFRSRTVGVGVLPSNVAVAYGCTGPVLRASGVPYDVRRVEPYSIYDEFDWDIVVRHNGDVFDRFMVRIDEMRQSLRILCQALDRLPVGSIQAGKKQHTVRIPTGEVYSRVEHPKGELGFYLVSDGGTNPYRYRVRTPSFIHLGVLEELCRGHKVADVVAILGSMDITLGEVDR